MTIRVRRPFPLAIIQPAIVDLLVTLGLALLAALLLLRPISHHETITFGKNDRATARDFWQPELAPDGLPFRWTNGNSSVNIPAQGSSPHLLALRLAAPPTATSATITINGAPLADLRPATIPRIYQFIVPPEHMSWHQTTIRFQSTTFSQPDDKRTIGLAVFRADLAALQSATWLPPVQVSVLALATLLLTLALRRAGLGNWRYLAASLFMAISLSMRHSDLRFNQRWEATLLSMGLLACFGIAWMALTIRPAPASEPVDRSSPVRDRRLALLLLFAGLAALLLIPLWPNVQRMVLGPPGDNFEYLWKLHWFADALIGNQQSPVFAPQLFYPTGFELAYSELTPANTLLGLPLTLLLGAVLTYNLLIYLSFVLTAFFTALLAERIGANRIGAIVAGIGVGFCLYRYQHILSQLPIAGTHWIILAIYGLEGFFQRRRAWDAFLLSLGTGLSAWSSWYYGPTLLLLLALYTLVRWPWAETRTLLAAWRPALIAPLVILALLAPYAQPYFQARQEGMSRHTYKQLITLSAQPADYLTPSRYHLLWGEWAQRSAPDVHGTRLVSTGIALLLLAGIGAWRFRRRAVVQTLLVIGIVNFVVSLGPEIIVAGMTIPLPVHWIYEYVPVLQSIRVWSRMAFYMQICVGVLAGLSFSGFNTWRRWQQGAGLALAFIVVIELMNIPLWSSLVEARPADRWLAEQPDRGAVAVVPDSFAGYNEYYARFWSRPLLSGYGTFLPPGTERDLAEISQFPEQAALTTLRRLGATYILVHTDQMDRLNAHWRKQAADLPELYPAYDSGNVAIYRLQP